MLTRSTVVVGTHTHMLLEDGRVMRAVDDEDEGGKESILQVTACRCIPREQLSDQAQAMCQGGECLPKGICCNSGCEWLQASGAPVAVTLSGTRRCSYPRFRTPKP